jgi:phosphonatase-like hydrolase
MAGTTVRDDGIVETAFSGAAQELGLPQGTAKFDEALSYVRETMGQSKIDVFTHLFGADRAQNAVDIFEKEMTAAISAGQVTALPGATETFAELGEAGVKICLTTGFSPTTRDAILDTLKWSELVDLALSPADAGRGRPYPDMILTAVLRLRVDDVRAVAVAGDTVSDLIAGTRSGAGLVAGVTTGAHSAEQLASAPHTHILPGVHDLVRLLTDNS